ncbi:hypothetical protein FEM48_Zijuj04G0035500 [Ziziphus jujuba var. spinosa]|uniref:CLAVATA3/ESR (CLE)-related protein 25-like n=1 Tax=Ziziphus jujuba var. spinosa TaxID=714518 RepID=A0A978VHK9_ZIZJJ|nr:hypothetical protein FEM48_Zijuj04G0035500 [Ziziphus jujuba var. spinosa]
MKVNNELFFVRSEAVMFEVRPEIISPPEPATLPTSVESCKPKLILQTTRIFMKSRALGITYDLLSHATITITSSTVPSVDNNQMLKHWNLNGRDQRHHSLRWASNLIYVSKRRVPNGPDPIHNRRAVKTRQPPGRA